MKRCAYKISVKQVSHILGKQPCQAIVRYTHGDVHVCARHETTWKADQYGKLVMALKDSNGVLLKRGMPSQHDLLGRARANIALLAELGEYTK